MADNKRKLPTDTDRARTGRKRGEDLSQMVFGKLPPQNLPLEEVVLGSIMLDKEALTNVIDVLQPETFYKEAHQHIYRAMRRLFERSQPIDMITVREELLKAGDLEAIGGTTYLVELTNKIASSANIEYHARILSQKWIQRELIRISNETIRDAYEDTIDVFDLLDSAEQGLFQIAEHNMGRRIDSMGSLSHRLLEELEELKNKKDGLTGIPSGFTDLDRLTSGLQRSDFIIVAARPAMGKTSFALSLAKNAAIDFEKPVAIFSLEMSSLQLATRIVAMEAEIEGSKMRSGRLEPQEWDALNRAIDKIGDAPVFIDDTPGINIFELRAKCRRLKLQHDIQLVIIDYLQLMTGGKENTKGNREQEVGAISRALKGLAKELDVPVIALAQLSRAVEVRGGNKKPMLSDLRESGCLTGDARLQRADTGEIVTIQELAERPEQHPIPVLAMNEDGKIGEHLLTKAFPSGKKPVFKLVTQSGRSILASANHPFRKSAGWFRLDTLQVGDLIAVANTGKHRRVFRKFEKLETSTSSAEDRATGPEQVALMKLAVSPDTGGLGSEIAWDRIAEIIPIGEEETYDATVPGVHNFVANNIVVHNSIEQDADIVCFLYRPEYYQIMEDEEGNSNKGVAEVIVAKHRHGPTDTIRLRFIDKYARFGNLDDMNFDELPGGTFDQPYNPNITLPSKINDDEDIPF